MDKVFYREDCEQAFEALTIEAGAQELAGFRAKCHPLAPLEYSADAGVLVTTCHDCHEVVMEFRVAGYLRPNGQAASCSCREPGVVEIGYRDGMVVVFCASCKLPTLGAEIAPRSRDAVLCPVEATEPAKGKWVN